MKIRTVAVINVVGILTLGAQVAFAQSTANFTRGDSVVVVTTVNVRSGPDGVVLGTQKSGAIGTLVGGPSRVGGYTWWDVDYGTGVDGWTAEDFMQSPKVSIQTNPGIVVALASHNGAQTSAETASAASAAPSLSKIEQQLQQLLAYLRSISQQ